MGLRLDVVLRDGRPLEGGPLVVGDVGREIVGHGGGTDDKIGTMVFAVSFI